MVMNITDTMAIAARINMAMPATEATAADERRCQISI